MLKKLIIKNFRCYENSEITFNGSSILVGRNNAGKSTMIEALKIISSVTRKYKTLRFTSAPDWLDDVRDFGVSPNVENMNISDRGIFNMYGDPPAIIEAQFSNETSIKAYVGEGLDIFAIIYDEDGYPIRSSREASRIDIPLIEVLPQISAVMDNEKVIKKQTVDGNRSTRLASRNFRNQLFYYQEAFPQFKSLAETTWETLQVKPVESYFDEGTRYLQFFVRVGNFEAEIGWMGHGLQMWIQTMWFVSQCPKNSVVILDEPDVYMHADLQRRLVRLLTPMFSQLIIATHSIEIIEEAPSDFIIPVDSKKRIIHPIGDEEALQQLVEHVGSPLNIDLARLFISQRFIIWEGDETSRKILSAFQSILFPEELHPLITYPKAFVNGWEDWEKVRAITEVFSSNKTQIQCYALFNSYMSSSEEIAGLMKEAKKDHVNLHMWKSSEIENYAINIDVIMRYLSHLANGAHIKEDSLRSVVHDIVDDLLDGYPVISYDANSDAEFQKKLCAVPGRMFFSRLSQWTKKNYGVNISALQVVPFFQSYEVPGEIRDVIKSIVSGKEF